MRLPDWNLEPPDWESDPKDPLAKAGLPKYDPWAPILDRGIDLDAYTPDWVDHE
ncbi:MAG: hypothetical protein AAGM22_22825 [Acidobacteriota bacterium]